MNPRSKRDYYIYDSYVLNAQFWAFKTYIKESCIITTCHFKLLVNQISKHLLLHSEVKRLGLCVWFFDSVTNFWFQFFENPQNQKHNFFQFKNSPRTGISHESIPQC